jgi:polysaccharide biosynthesis protein PelF
MNRTTDPRDLSNTQGRADVCIFVEGAYPYVPGGVSRWLHQLIESQPRLTFHVVTLVSPTTPTRALFELPSNVVSLSRVLLQPTVTDCPDDARTRALVRSIAQPLSLMLERGGRGALQDVVRVLDEHRGDLNLASMLNSPSAYELVQRMYEQSVPSSAFLPYFWSWRAMVGAMLSVLLMPLPEARAYHAVATGYAGLAMARATLASGRPGILTEHGIYTNERRAELAMADWLHDSAPLSLSVDRRRLDLRDVWMRAFESHARTTYESALRIVTLHSGNQVLQERDGAPWSRMTLIPNGVDVKRLRSIERRPNAKAPTVALVGRVVPIKDVKTYLRAVALLRERIPTLNALVVGPISEDPIYHRACLDMVKHLGLEDCLRFTGPMPIESLIPTLDLLVLTSLSEAQPLVMLEAGAAGIPCVSTDVGGCREIILGRDSEFPRLPAGGLLTAMVDPMATAHAMHRLLNDETLRERCGKAMRERVRRYHNFKLVRRAYRELYAQVLTTPTQLHAPSVRRTLVAEPTMA